MKSKRPFAKGFHTFEEWDAQAGSSEYAQRIRRRHARRPNATLSQLSGRPAKGQGSLVKVKPLPLWQLPPSALTPRERRLREQSLEVVAIMRREKKPLSAAIEGKKITQTTVVRNAGGALKATKRGRDYRAKPSDPIGRPMKLHVNGSVIVVVVNSKNGSKIGQYENARGIFVETHDPLILSPFVDFVIKDINGHRYRPDTDPEQIREAYERREEPEFYKLYAEW